MICPRCDAELKEFTLVDTVLDRCEECGGIWFDFAELERIMSREARALVRFIPRETAQKDLNVETLPCPRCEDRLIRLRAPFEKMVYYSCLTCYGRWLDGSELARLIDRSMAIKFESLFRQLLD